MKTLGLIGGMSWESTAIYYRLLNDGAKERLGGLHSAQLLFWSFDFADVAARQASGDWDGLAAHDDRCGPTARARRSGGARDLHQHHAQARARCVERGVGVPIIHIVDVTAEAIGATPGPPGRLARDPLHDGAGFLQGAHGERHGIEPVVPDETGRALVHGIIYDELCRGIVRPELKRAYLAEIAKLRQRGADGIILGCTEVGMILAQSDFDDLPVFDSTALHAAAALDFAIS